MAVITDRTSAAAGPSPLTAVAGFAAQSHLRAIALLIAVSLLAFWPGITQLPPIDRDEPRYAQAAKQMNETGEYIDIRFQDGPRYLQPAGIYWLQAGTAKLLGYGAKAPIWVHRIPSLIGATAAVVLTYWVALPFAGPAGGFIAALLMAASVLLGVEARLAKTDAVLLCCILGAIGILARAYLGQAVTLAGAAVFWCALAAGVLVKGPLIAMVVGLLVLVLSVWDRSLAWLRPLRPVPGLLLLLLLVLPWFIAIGFKTDGQFYARSLGQNFLGKIGRGEQGHGAPPGTYLLAFWLTYWPAAGLALIAAPWAWMNRTERSVRFCLAWIVPTWLAFELVATKLPHYVLPVYPAISILIAMALLAGKRPAPWLAYAMTVFAFVIGLGGVGLLYWFEGQVAWLALAVSLAAAVLMVWGMGHARTLQPVPLAMTIAFPAIAVIMVTFGLVLPRAETLWLSPRLVAAIERNAACGNPQVASTGYHEASLVFLAGTGTRLVWPKEAAQFVAAGGCRVVLVTAAYEPVFLVELANLGGRAMVRERVTGLNFGGGRQENIAVYVPQ